MTFESWCLSSVETFLTRTLIYDYKKTKTFPPLQTFIYMLYVWMDVILKVADVMYFHWQLGLFVKGDRSEQSVWWDLTETEGGIDNSWVYKTVSPNKIFTKIIHGVSVIVFLSHIIEKSRKTRNVFTLTVDWTSYEICNANDTTLFNFKESFHTKPSKKNGKVQHVISNFNICFVDSMNNPYFVLLSIFDLVRFPPFNETTQIFTLKKIAVEKGSTSFTSTDYF